MCAPVRWKELQRGCGGVLCHVCMHCVGGHALESTVGGSMGEGSGDI